MKKTIIQSNTPAGKFVVIRNGVTNYFPLVFSGGYSIGSNDTNDIYNLYEHYQSIETGSNNNSPIGLDFNLFPELKNKNNKAFLTNTGIVVIFTGTHAIIYDILDNNPDSTNLNDIVQSSTNNFFNVNNNNPENHKYISVKSSNGIVYGKKELLFINNGRQYFSLDVDKLELNNATYFDSEYNLYYGEVEGFDETEEIFRFNKRQMYVFQSNFNDLSFYIEIDGIETNIPKITRHSSTKDLLGLYNYNSFDYLNQYIIDLTNYDILKDSEDYVDFLIKRTSKDEEEGWLEVF